MSSEAAPLEGTFVRRRPPVAVRRRRVLVAVANHSLLIATALDLPAAVRVRPADVADDEPAGALAQALARPVRVAQLRGRLLEGAALALRAEHAHLRRPRHARAAGLEHPGRLRARPPALAREQCGVPDHARRVDAAAAGDRHPGLRALREAAPRRLALAADHPELVRRRLRDLPAAPVLPDHPRGIPRRRARGRLRRVPDPDDRRPTSGQAGDRGGGAVLVPLLLQRLLRAAALHRRELAALDALARAVAVPLALPGAVEPGHGGDA